MERGQSDQSDEKRACETDKVVKCVVYMKDCIHCDIGIRNRQ